MYDIEAHLTDCKSYGQTNFDRGYIDAGEPMHDLWIRFTVDETMHIRAVEAVSDKTPYKMCPTAAPNFARLAGLQIKAGFLREANKLVGGVVGLHASAGTAAAGGDDGVPDHQPVQGAAGVQAEGKHDDKRGSDALDKRITEKWGGGMRILNTCLAYDEKGPLVQRRWPNLYIGPDRIPAGSDKGGVAPAGASQG